MVVVPVYHKIRVTFVDVQKWITKLHELFSVFLKGVPLEWDLHLVTVNLFKEEVRNSSRYFHIRRKLLLKPFPKYLWRAVLSAGKIEVFECLVDATDMMQSAPFIDMFWYHNDLKAAVGEALTDPSISDVVEETLTPRLAEVLRDHTVS